MQRTSILLGLLGALALAGPSHAAVPSTVFGKWIERFPDGNGMVTEFTAGAISSYPVDQAGRATAAPTAMPVSYVDLGGPMLGVSFHSGGGAVVAKQGDDAMTLDMPGIGAHQLIRVKANGADQSIG